VKKEIKRVRPCRKPPEFIENHQQEEEDFNCEWRWTGQGEELSGLAKKNTASGVSRLEAQTFHKREGEEK